MHQILVFSFSLVTFEFSINNFFKTRMLLEIFDAEFPYKPSYFEPLCLLNKMAAKNVKRSILSGLLLEKLVVRSVFVNNSLNYYYLSF